MMSQSDNPLVFNTTAAKHSTLLMEIDVARRVGFAGLETTAEKVRSYLDADHSVSDLKAALDGLPVYGIGTVLNIERHGDEASSLMSEATAIFEVAHTAGARAVQVINGPLDYREVVRFREGKLGAGYRGVLEYDHDQRIEITAANLRMLAKLAQEFDLIVYLEALAWSPVNSLADQLKVLRAADQDNFKIVIDYWHCYASGDRPEDIAAIDPDLIYGVHVCDSLPLTGDVPNESVLRDVPTGQGVLDLKAWTAAVKATRYQGWWCSETFCRKIQQENTYEVASQMKSQLTELIGSK